MYELKTLNKPIGWLKQNAIIFALIALFVLFSYISPTFRTADNLTNIARQVSFIGISSVGMMFVLLTGGIDLSVGSIVQFVNVLCAFLIVEQGFPIWVAVFVCFALSMMFGLINGVMVSKIKIPPLIATLASLNTLNGFAFLISGGLPIFGFPDGFSTAGQGHVGPVPIPVVIMVVVFVCGAFILKKTYIGRAYYAIGGNAEATRLSGINVDRHIISAYVFSAFLACLAGLVMLSRLNSGTPNTGRGFEFQVITAVVLGGISVSGGVGKILGVIIGVLIIGVLNNGLILVHVNVHWQSVVNGLVLAIAVGVDCYSKTKGEKRKL